ncbi:MAG: TolC family protein [Candidatus Tectomicrobia bacterium]|nr:TolC family protein [Candidatus Tectomicrobia bacterium]
MKIGRALLGRFLLVTLLVAVCGAGRVEGREFSPPLPSSPPDRPEVTLPLSIEQAMELALRNNLSISIERTSVEISDANLEAAQGEFDPRLFAGPALRRTVVPVSSALSRVGAGAQQLEIDEENLDFNAGVRKRLDLGASVELEFSANRLESTQGFQNFRPRYAPSLDLSLTQPLLRNFGREVTRSRIIVAQTNRVISAEAFRQRVMEIVALVRDTYWDVVFARGDLAVRRQSLQLARELVEINRAQVEVGTMAPIEILQAQTRAAQREEEVIIGEKAVADAIDRLLRVMNVFGNSLVSNLLIVPSDEPKFEERSVELEAQIALALQNQPNLTLRRLDLDNLRLNARVQRNRLLPALDLQASVGLNGLAGETQAGVSPFEGDFGDSLDRLRTGDFYQFSVGLNFELPLGNRTARGEASRARLELARAELQIRDLEQEVVRQVNEAVRRLTTGSKRIASTRIARRLAEQQLEAEQKRFNVGLSTSFNVLEFQEDLATSRRNELLAIIDYNKAQIALAQITGVILGQYHVELRTP